jgi:hypothetical protein
MNELTKQKPVAVKIEHTYEYNKFKLVGINRDVDKKHASGISEAILNRNLLHLFPLIVNTKWEVMDGQHRLSAVKIIEAARAQQLPLYYIMDPEITLDDISLLNSNKINWKNIDYVNFYAGKETPAYQSLSEFMVKNPKVPLSTCLRLIHQGALTLTDFKKGLMNCRKIERAYEIMRIVYDLRKKMNSRDVFWKSGFFILAVREVYSTGKYNHLEMMASPQNKAEFWSKQISQHSYVFEINSIYNYGKTDKQRINFLTLPKEII